MNTDWLVVSTGNSFIRICNQAGKQWLFPTKNMKRGSLIFQPSSKKGRLLKKILIAGSLYLPILKLKYEEEYLALNDVLTNAIKKTFGINRFEFSVFLGTPGVHQKAVLQIFDDNIIYGYVKITDKELVYDLFKSEEKILSLLKVKGVQSIPIPLLIKKENGYSFYIQTTEKSIYSHEPINFSKLQLTFLGEMCKKTEVTIRYEESAFYKNIHMPSAERQFSKISDLQRKNFIQTAYETSLKIFDCKYNGKILKLSVAHRDFTPWNMCVDRGKLFVFDWEYSSAEYFPMVDLIHYIIQSKVFDASYNTENIVGYLHQFERKLSSYCNKYTTIEYRDIMTAYLMDFISQYLTRGSNYISKAEMKGLLLRCELLKIYNCGKPFRPNQHITNISPPKDNI